MNILTLATLRRGCSLLGLSAALCFGAPSVAAGATFYVAPLSTSCASTAGSGTLSDPWQNLFSALTRNHFSPGDVINLRGGTYRNTYSGFAAGCNMAGDPAGVNTVLPLNLTGANGNPIIVQNYANETVIIDGSDADLIGATWTACGTGSWQLNNPINVGSSRTGQVWVSPARPNDSGTRLAYDANTGGCGGMSPGTFRFSSGGTGLFARLPIGSAANVADVHLSCESGDCASYPVNDGPSANYVTVRKSPGGGAFWVKYGYYAVRVDNHAQHLIFDGIDILAAGGRDYGSCIRVYNGAYITFQNTSCRESAGEGIQLYGGGPGGGNGGGIQIANNTFDHMTVSHTGFAWVDGGGIGNNLGFGVIIKNCSNCALLSSTVSASFGTCLEVTTSTDAGESDGVIINGNNFSDCGYLNRGAGNRTLSCVQVEPQRSAPNGAVRNVTQSNNVCHNETFGSGASWPAQFGGGTVNGISLSDAGQTPMTGNTIVNNSFDYLSGPGLNMLEVAQPVTFRNNAFGGNLATHGNVCNGNGPCDVMAGAVNHLHSNNTYWAGAPGTQVIYINGAGSYARDTATWYESSAVQSDPMFASSSNLKILPSSALINAGSSLGCGSVVAGGVTGAGTTRCDVGASDFIGAISTPVTPTHIRIKK